MLLHKLLDGEFFKLQNHLSSLETSLPCIKPNSYTDRNSLIKALMVQNKAYARKIISLMEEMPLESLDIIANKTQAYEDLIRKLTNENQEFIDQLTALKK